MKLEDVLPAHCYARAQRLLAETVLVRDEMGRSEDTRAVPEISGAQPREVYFEALAAWRKAQRLSDEPPWTSRALKSFLAGRSPTTRW